MLLVSMAAAGQGIVPVTTNGAIDAKSGNKTAISDDHTLNVVFTSGGKVMVARSVGGGAWETPVAISGTATAPTNPVIAAGSDGTVAVAFINADHLYYTYETRGGPWSAPEKLLSDEVIIHDVAMTASGAQVHLGANAGGDVVYLTFPSRDPKTTTTEYVTSNTLCCPNTDIAFVSIVVAGPPGAERPYIAYSFMENGTSNTAPCCTFHGYRAGVRVETRQGDAAIHGIGKAISVPRPCSKMFEQSPYSSRTTSVLFP